MKKPINPNTRAERDMFFLDSLFNGSSETITRQEAQGQTSFVNSDTLPRAISPSDKQILESEGFEFLGLVEDDDLFQYVKMPEGWSKRPTEHSMWSDLIDPKGRIRGHIFYKAAFYDRKADMRLKVRYVTEQDYDAERKQNLITVRVIDSATNNAIFSPPSLSGNTNSPLLNSQIAAGLRQQCAEWLKNNYPDADNAGAYWD